MPFSHTDFAAKFPYVFHLTARCNLTKIAHDRKLNCASTFLSVPKRRLKRREHLQVVIDDHTISIRDQAPLYEGNVALSPGTTFADFVNLLNERIFFWPGNDTPIPSGRNHFARYAHENPVILRIPTEDLFAANTASHIEFCKYNSGAPRCNRGQKSPRGPETFLPADTFPHAVRAVCEVTLRPAAVLPATTQVGNISLTEWQALS